MVCNSHQHDNMDLSSQMLAKIGRRVQKLENMPVCMVGSQIKSTCLTFVESVVGTLSQSVNEIWEEISFPSINSSKIESIQVTPVGINKSLQHHIPLLDKHINDIKLAAEYFISHMDTLQKPSADLSKCLKRYLTIEDILAGQNSGSNYLNERRRMIEQLRSRMSSLCIRQPQNVKTKLWLHDTEIFMKRQLDDCTSESILQLIFKYVKVASTAYKNGVNPVGFSQMLLCVLKAVQVLDKIATQACPLLLEYGSGIRDDQFVGLLLPHIEDMRLLDELLDYFKARDGMARFESILYSGQISADTFAVRYAKNDKEMQALRLTILANMEQKKAEKNAEVDKVRAACEALQELIALEESCKCEWETVRGRRIWVSFTCDRCKLQSTLNEKKKTVSVYEIPLPTTEICQNAVIFELMLPSKLKQLRDALAFLDFEILPLRPFEGPSNCTMKWLEYSGVSKFQPSCKQGQVVNLFSNSLPASKTHHTRLSNPDVLSNDNSKFIVNNGMNCIYHNTKLGYADCDVEKSCTFQISNTCSPDKEMYQNLQYTVTSTAHSQNKVIADSHGCHRDMMITEFIAFGSVRAGHRIQLRNLYRLISNRTLALEKEATTCLILQTMWQVGPKDKDGNRGSHLDFSSNDSFAQDFLEVLEQVVDLNETNYSHPLILFNVVIITMRIMELNQSCIETGAKLLRKCRKVVDDWVKRIGESILKQADGSSERVKSLKKRLLEATLCSAFTFNTPSLSLLKSVIYFEEDLLHWYATLSRLNDLTEMEKLPTSNFGENLVYHAFEVALKVQDRIATASAHYLHNFASTQWHKATECTLRGGSWSSVGNKNNVFMGEYTTVQNTSHFVTFDILLGTFLVDGQPQGVLPAEIETHELYRRFFNKNKLKIQKDYQSYRTVVPFHGKHYEFMPKSGTRNFPRIKELDKDGSWELLNPAFFEGHIASSFIKKYTHWLNSTGTIVYFRAQPSQHSDYKLLPIDFMLTRDTIGFWKLQDMKEGYHFVSIKSEEFTAVCGALKRLENQEFINLIVDPKSGVLTAKLPRYNLKFDLVGQHLQSVEYPDFKISCDQSMGTLVGLQQGILMDNNNSSESLGTLQVPIKQILIVPHGTINVREGERSHQRVEIEFGSLRQPPFFAYEIDEELQRLKADKSKAAWLYLAALHAATSSSLPDKFTQITGTEMAVWILQSALVWSCSPYDPESLAILKTIKDFSPVRTNYGGGYVTSQQMEVTTWPIGLPSLASYDGFALIVDQLMLDSQRLAPLYPVLSTDAKEKSQSSAGLQMRAYRRSLSFYNQNVALKPKFLPVVAQSLVGTGKVEHPQLRTKLNCIQLLSVSESMFLHDKYKFPLSNRNYGIVSYLITSEPLSISPPIESLRQMSLSQLLEFKFRANWLRLYSYCWSQKRKLVCSQDELYEEVQAWKVLLANLSYCDPSLVEQIMNMHFIASYADYFPEPPESNSEYDNPAENAFVGETIEKLLKSHSCNFSSWEDYLEQKCSLKHAGHMSWLLLAHLEKCTKDHIEERKNFLIEQQKFETELKKDKNAIIKALKEDWPCSTVRNEREKLFASPKLKDVAKLLARVNTLLRYWHKNYELAVFVREVERALNCLTRSTNVENDKTLNPSGKFLSRFGEMKKITIPIHIKSDIPLTINLEGQLGSFLTPMELGFAEKLFSNRWIKNKCQSGIPKIMESSSGLIAEFSGCIAGNLQNTICKKIALQAGICPRTNPPSLLSFLTYQKANKSRSQLESVVGALAVLWTHVKRHNRIRTLQSKGDAMSVELKREWENTGHQNWNPAEHPAWLLLELELDMMIRPIQVEVARQMMKMPGGKNGVMQLNMGEGKTSVIVPMLCATLSNDTTLCRVTVLNSIFKTNLKILSFSIGGLLNRRLYTFPCRRDMDIDASCLDMMNHAYAECLRLRGVVLTRPEHRLSFRLKVYDQIVKGSVDFGLSLLTMENWLREHARDILDESDELLSVKYQLVYTIGAQVPIDGGDLRWKTCQKLLNIVMDIANDLYEQYGSSNVEFNPNDQKEKPEKFNHFRLLSPACKEEFCSSVADRFLQELKLTSKQRNDVRLFLTENNLEQPVHTSVLALFKDSPDLLGKILLVSGYIRRGILELALSKRWRVEYGVDPKGLRKMAVPFRAKDVAAERTEFGHPDLAIILTHLSYYYSGLSDQELRECFDRLAAKPGPDMIYSSWLQIFPKEKVPSFLQTYQGLNTKDPYHCYSLFNLLREHKLVIDFYLSEKVFSRESKQFPGKIVMTAWDLCYERNQHSTSGFSGTNDSSILLPLQITQQDLPILIDTNSNLEATLLQPKNKNHKGFHMGVTCHEILEEMKKDGLQVLIDSGAIMLNCDNEHVAKLWLEIDKGIEAVVYFSQDNDMLVKCRGRNMQDLPFELSPFRSSLSKCGVFLDDHHSRGTDLKFPTGFKACVTIGTRMRRDKLMQACMRMRKLDNGHSVTFYLSHEAFDKVMKLKSHQSGYKSSDEPTLKLETQDVINWVCQNTKEFNNDGMLYWALAGKNYAQKLAAEDTFHYPQHLVPSYNKATFGSRLGQYAKILGSQCVDNEVLLLKDMYGIYTETSLLVKLIPDWFNLAIKKFLGKNGGRNMELEILEKLSSICNGIIKRCAAEVPTKLHISSMLEEEQEKELEKEAEIEEEREIERPKSAQEALPSLHANILEAVLHGTEITRKPGIFRLSYVFQNTSFWNQVQPDCWGPEVFASGDFISVIETPTRYSKTDMHLRPVEYLVSRKVPDGSIQLLILSPFEVNELMPHFRRGQTSLKLHMFTMRRFERQDVLINNGRLQLPLCQQVSTIPEESRAMAAMLVASGSLYFNSKSEQQAFARFLALVPQPWSDQQTLAFEHGMITNSGFLRPEFRRHFQVESFSFLVDPIGLVKKILRCRHPVVNEVAHVIRLLDETLYVPINQ